MAGQCRIKCGVPLQGASPGTCEARDRLGVPVRPSTSLALRSGRAVAGPFILSGAEIRVSSPTSHIPPFTLSGAERSRRDSGRKIPSRHYFLLSKFSKLHSPIQHHPSYGPKNRSPSKWMRCVGVDLVAGSRAVDGPVWLVGIVKRNTRFNKLVHGLSSESLAGVRGIFTPVMLTAIRHNGRNPHERFFHRLPGATIS